MPVPALPAASVTPVFSRVTVVLLPFVALWAAVGVNRLAIAATRVARVPASWLFATGLVLACALALPRAYAFAHLTSGHAEAAQYVLTHGNGKQMVLGLPVEQYDLGSFEGTYPVPLSFDEMRKLHREAGVRLLVLDLRVHILEEWGHPLGPALRELENRFTPVATIPSTAGATLVLAGENAQARESLERTLRDPRSGQIRIYDLAAVFDR